MRKAILLFWILLCPLWAMAQDSGRSGYVLPAFSVDDAMDRSNAKTKSAGKFLESDRTVQLTNLTNSVLGELGVRHLNSPGMSALPNHVLRVVEHSSSKQMLVIAAGRPVTFVENLYPISNWTIPQTPRHAMHQLNPTVLIADHSVSLVVKGADPRPARAELWAHDRPIPVNPVQDLYLDRDTQSFGAGQTAELPASASDFARVGFKRFGTDGTNDGDHIPSNQGQSVSDDLAGRPIGNLLFADQASQVKQNNTSYHTQKQPNEKSGWKKVVTIIFYPLTPWRRDTEDRAMNVLNGAYVGVGYVDLYTTFRALNASPTIRETSPIFGQFFTGPPHPAAAFAVHTGVNYAFLSGIRLAHNWVHDQNSLKRGKWKRAGEYVLCGLVVGLTIDRAFAAKHNLKLARKYGK